MKSQRNVSILILQMIVLFLSFGIMKSQTWQFTNGPYRSHEVRDISASLSGGVQRIYAADAETLKYSTNGGTNWLNTSNLMLNPLVIASKPDNPNMIHVGKSGRLERSSDGGSTWENPPKIDDANLVPLRLSESVNNTDIWLLGADTVKRVTTWTTSLYRTTTGGATWSTVNYFVTNAHTNVNEPLFDPRSSSQYVWVGGSTKPVDQTPDMSAPASTPTKGVWYSADGGANWSFRTNFPSNGSTDKNVTAMALSDGSSSDVLYSVTTKDVSGTKKAQLYSIDPAAGDVAWTTGVNLYDSLDAGTGQQLKISLVRSLKVNPADAYNLIAVTDKGLAVSTDRGATWRLRSYPSDIITAHQVIPDRINNNIMYLGTDQSIYTTSNQGQNWSEGNGIWSFLNASAVAVNGSTAHAVSNSYYGIARSSSGTWDITPKLVGQKMFSGYDVTINKNYTSYANAVGDSAGLAVIYVRTDGGDGWRKVFTSATGSYSTPLDVVIADPKVNSQRVFAGGNFHIGSSYYNLIFSVDKGVSWNYPIKIGTGDGVPVKALAIDSGGSIYSHSTTIYAGLGYDGGLGQGIRKSTDGGITWNICRLYGDTIISVTMNPKASSQILYLGSPTFLWKSTDALAVNPTMLSVPFYGAKSIVMHPSYPNSANYLWVVTGDGNKIYKTINGGSTWSEINTANIPKPINKINTDPTNNANIYAATSSGVYSVNPPPEVPTGFTVAGSNCTATVCQTLKSSSTILAPAPCRPVLSWSSNAEADLSSTNAYKLERKIDNSTWDSVYSGTGLSFTDGEVTLSSNGTHYVVYRVMANDNGNNPSGYTSEICVMASSVPSELFAIQSNPVESCTNYEFKLLGNYPNPFNPTTRIQYSIAEQSQVRLVVYDVLGREVATLINEIQSPGMKEVKFDISDSKSLASGFYFYKLEAGYYTSIKKMLLLR
jgi:photosystem II stability/assembly factor-like uncharacterized protein